MADVSKIKLPDGTIVNIKDGRLPITTSTDNGKIVAIDSSGKYTIIQPIQTAAYVSETTLYINTNITDGDGVDY